MSKPTDDEMAIALKEAAYMREHDSDPKFMAKALLNTYYRLTYFEKVFKVAERYMLFGMEEAEHQLLLKEIENVREEERRIKKEEPSSFGLDD